jgi:hypothetical protein
MRSFSTLNRSLVYIYPPCDFMRYGKNVTRLKIYYSFEKKLIYSFISRKSIAFREKNGSN